MKLENTFRMHTFEKKKKPKDALKIFLERLT